MSTAQHFFPVRLPAVWRNRPATELSPNLLDWLLDESSLTARLKALSDTFHVEVLGERTEPCPADEATAEVIEGEMVLVREVLLFCDDRPHVFARSLLPLTSLTGEEQRLATLGNMPLGQVLFSDPRLVRKDIEVACFNEHSEVAKVASHYQLPVSQSMWGRRSTFLLNHKPLTVAEVFLPGSFAYHK
ncbi:chorismate--pyruvate lyase family protein [Thalassotalea ganghwensis]